MTAFNEGNLRSASAVDFFDSSAVDYAGKHYEMEARTFMTVRQQRVMEFLDQLALAPGAPVLDAGCGPGHIVKALARRGLRVSAMDGAEGMLKVARTQLAGFVPAHPVDFKQGDIEHLPYADASFEMVCSTGVIEYLPEDSKVLREFHRVLKPGGALLLPVTNASTPALWLDTLVESLKRQPLLLDPFNAVWKRLGRTPILPRHFAVRRHRVPQFLASVREAGFVVEDGIYFHFLPWPRPIDQLLPKLTSWLGERMERNARGMVAPMGEGYLLLGRKPATG